MRWVGIDEAGYGPNLGPLVMTAVVAEAANGWNGRAGMPPAPVLWHDLAATVDRAGGEPAKLWVDDSKAILRGGKGRDRLELASLAVVHAATGRLPRSLGELLDALGIADDDDAELLPWCAAGRDPVAWPSDAASRAAEQSVALRPLAPPDGAWRIASVHTVLVGPRRFNASLERHGVKSAVHFEAFAKLLQIVWEMAGDGVPAAVCGDKHGGRNFYLPSLYECLPDAWIERGPEGAELSRYMLRDRSRRLELTFLPRADQSDGLVALASIVSKTVREVWMDLFNAYWQARVPGLRPTAGYHVDAVRFRHEIEAAPAGDWPDLSLWWRCK